jgi:phosphatidylethanolamine N-methyltransferase
MRKLYGPDLRKDAGLTKTIKKVTRNQARLLRQKAPELERVVQEVRGTIDKVYADTAQIVEEFLTKCAFFNCFVRNCY